MASDWTKQFPDLGHPGYVDYEKFLVFKGMVIDFYHIPSGYSVAFKGMINSFSDEYSSEWNSESVYGWNFKIHRKRRDQTGAITSG